MCPVMSWVKELKQRWCFLSWGSAVLMKAQGCLWQREMGYQYKLGETYFQSSSNFIFNHFSLDTWDQKPSDRKRGGVTSWMVLWLLSSRGWCCSAKGWIAKAAGLSIYLVLNAVLLYVLQGGRQASALNCHCFQGEAYSGKIFSQLLKLVMSLFCMASLCARI